MDSQIKFYSRDNLQIQVSVDPGFMQWIVDVRPCEKDDRGNWTDWHKGIFPSEDTAKHAFDLVCRTLEMTGWTLV